MLLERLSDLAEKGQELRESGEFTVDKEGKAKGVFGFAVKFGKGNEGIKVEPFGNLKKDSRTGKTVTAEVNEPLVDIFEEPDHVMVVAELPGIDSTHVTLEVHGNTLAITASNGSKKYHKEVNLPGAFTREQATFSCRNGILEIRLQR